MLDLGGLSIVNSLIFLVGVFNSIEWLLSENDKFIVSGTSISMMNGPCTTRWRR